LDFGLFCVADGLGGYEGGNVASAVAVRTVAHKLTQGAFLRWISVDADEEEQSLEELVREAFELANQEVVARADGGATTLTAALLLGERLMIGHVGDTRAYFLQGDEAEVLTPDHSLVQQLIETGAMSEQEARESPHRSVLWNAMGKTERLKVDVFSRHVPVGGHLLLCSDGLWDSVAEEVIIQIVRNAETPQEACDTLVRAANEAGGPDNITAVLVTFPSDD
jgi:serine/threonine protein phosphatase PrpC